MENTHWESKYNQLLVTYEEFQRSSRELEEDLESDLQQKEEQLLTLSRQLEKLKYDLLDAQKSAEKEKHAAALQNDRLLTQVQVLKDAANAEKKVRVRLELANEDLEGNLRILQRENEEATERLETAIEDQVVGQQDYDDARRELQHVQEQLQKAEKLIERLEQTSKTVTNSTSETALIDSLRAEIEALKESKKSILPFSSENTPVQSAARMRRLEALQKIAKQREERLVRQSVEKRAPLISNLISKAGLLDKKERSLDSWKTQFCSINVTDRTFELFIVIPGTQEGGNVHKKVGSLRLTGCQLEVKRKGKRQFALQPSHSKNKTVFRCQTDEDLEQWLEALQLGITDIAQGPEATVFLRGRGRAQTLSRTIQIEGTSLGESSNDKAFVWQKDSVLVKEGSTMKLKFGCDGSEPSDWISVGLKLSLGSPLIEIFSLQTSEKRGAIALLVYERGELGAVRFRTADTHGCVTNVLLAHSGPFEYVLQFSSISERMEWMRAIRFCTTPREQDVRLEGSLFLPGLKVEDPFRETYCTLLMSRVNPGIMNFFDSASNELVVVRCFRLAKACVLTLCSDPCAFTLTQTDSVMLRAKDAFEAKQWMSAIASVLSDLDEQTAVLPRPSEAAGKFLEESAGLHRSPSDAFSFSNRLSMAEGESRSALSVDVATRSKSGRLLEMNNSLIGVSWKPRFFSIDATSRMLEYSQVGKRCISKNCSALSEVSGGYCPQCMRKIMDGEDDEPRKLSRTASFSATLLQRLAGNSPSKNSLDSTSPRERTLNSSERDVRKPHFIPLARAVVAPVPPKKAGGRSHCFVLTPHHSKREYILQAADDQDMQDWVEVLSSRTKMEELPALSIRGLLSTRNVRLTGTIVPWKARWFVLENNLLIHRKGEQEKGGQTITLTSQSHVGVVEGQNEASAQFEFWLSDTSEKETIHFLAENKVMGKKWLTAIEKVIRHEQSITEPSRRVSDDTPLSRSPSPPASLFAPVSSPLLSPSSPVLSSTSTTSTSTSSSTPTSSTISTSSASPPLVSKHLVLAPARSALPSILLTSPSPPPPPPFSSLSMSSEENSTSSTSSLPRPPSLIFDLSSSRLEMELMQQKTELEAQLRKREAELRQRDAELEEAKKLIIHLKDGTQQKPEFARSYSPVLERKMFDAVMPHTTRTVGVLEAVKKEPLSVNVGGGGGGGVVVLKGGERKQRRGSGGEQSPHREDEIEKKKLAEEMERRIQVDRKRMEEQHNVDELKQRVETTKLEEENAKLKNLLFAEREEKEKIRRELESERKKKSEEAVLPSGAEKEKQKEVVEKKELEKGEAEEREIVKLEEAERARIKAEQKEIQDEARKRKLKETSLFNAKMKQEDLVRQKEADKRKAALEAQWKEAEAEKEKLMKEYAEQQKREGKKKEELVLTSAATKLQAKPTSPLPSPLPASLQSEKPQAPSHKPSPPAAASSQQSKKSTTASSASKQHTEKPKTPTHKPSTDNQPKSPAQKVENSKSKEQQVSLTTDKVKAAATAAAADQPKELTLAEKQKQEMALAAKKQAERQERLAEKQRLEAEQEKKRLAVEVGRRAHLEKQWLLAEQEKQRLIAEEKQRIIDEDKAREEQERLAQIEKEKAAAANAEKLNDQATTKEGELNDSSQEKTKIANKQAEQEMGLSNKQDAEELTKKPEDEDEEEANWRKQREVAKKKQEEEIKKKQAAAAAKKKKEDQMTKLKKEADAFALLQKQMETERLARLKAQHEEAEKEMHFLLAERDKERQRIKEEKEKVVKVESENLRRTEAEKRRLQEEEAEKRMRSAKDNSANQQPNNESIKKAQEEADGTLKEQMNDRVAVENAKREQEAQREKESQSQDQAEEERQFKEQAERERQLKEQAEREKQMKEQADKERQLQEQANKERQLKEQAEREKQMKEQAEEEKQLAEQQSKLQEQQAEQEKRNKEEQAEQSKKLREQQLREQEAILREQEKEQKRRLKDEQENQQMQEQERRQQQDEQERRLMEEQIELECKRQQQAVSEQEQLTNEKPFRLSQTYPFPSTPSTSSPFPSVLSSTFPPSSPAVVYRPSRLEVPQSPDASQTFSLFSSPSITVTTPESEIDRASFRKSVRKAPPKFGTLQNLEKPIDVASLRNIFETQERSATLNSPLKEGFAKPPPPPPQHPDTPFPIKGQPPSSPLR